MRQTLVFSVTMPSGKIGGRISFVNTLLYSDFDFPQCAITKVNKKELGRRKVDYKLKENDSCNPDEKLSPREETPTNRPHWTMM